MPNSKLMMKERLFPVMVGDVMDTLGLDHQFLPADVRPIDPLMTLAGRAVPVLSRDVNHPDPRLARLSNRLDS